MQLLLWVVLVASCVDERTATRPQARSSWIPTRSSCQRCSQLSRKYVIELRGGQSDISDHNFISDRYPNVNPDTIIPELGNISLRQYEQKLAAEAAEDLEDLSWMDDARNFEDLRVSDDEDMEWRWPLYTQTNNVSLDNLPSYKKDMITRELDLLDPTFPDIYTKYEKVFVNEVNESHIPESFKDEICDVDFEAGISDMLRKEGMKKEGEGVEVTPVLPAWRAGINAGDVLVKIGNTTIDEIADIAMEKYRNYLQAFITKGTEIKLEMDAIKRLNKGAELWSYNVNDTKLLVEREIQERLTGPRGEGVNVTIVETQAVSDGFLHVCGHGNICEHKDDGDEGQSEEWYNGKPVFRTFHIKFSDDLALPPNWGYEVVEAWVSKRTHHLKCQLNVNSAELLNV
ncbi:hypothetical protein GUITHDRAFT_116708 [Guillardia theta CCMP2712]|uniref:PDZ domain-containing protein n=1 Tax=Guillardia theta (strain CCMP2712) TaxID=905079 RepID=L1IMT9_GUITC|nr:hypothetical protein GUITHDRAFT_116708 [Guillardia theta CCMP2712]EKX37130.1 hypothetical protein GUITHDRAFT_116708 [Guillardia theta CCMP2712]|eukprot:XP_005824110.1 hypothetical protein GUITHDRAFT_116708 [Guillardia theta CCMP2712]